MPGFANLSSAALAAAIAVPALLLLYFLKLRRKEMPVSSTLLWRKTIEDLQVNAPFQRLRKNLLLLLQLLLLLLLCLALARPLRSTGAGLGKKAVLLIDHSASMNAREAGGKTRLVQAQEHAEKLIAAMGSDSQAMIISFADNARIEQPFTSDRAALRNAIADIQSTDRGTKLELAYKLADAQGTDAEAWIFSDGRAADADRARIRLVLHDEKIGSANAGNVGIVAMDARRDYDDPTLVRVFARLANFGPEPINADAQLSVALLGDEALQWQVVRVASTYLLPERWTPEQRQAALNGNHAQARDSVEFDLPLTTGAIVRIQQMHADALAADDIAMAVIPPPRQLRAMLVTDGNYFLEKALQSLDLREPRILTPRQYEASWSDPKKNPSQYDAIIFDDYVPKRLPAAGNFIWFGAVPPGIGVTANKNASGFVRSNNTRFLDWQTQHPILRGLSLQSVTLRTALSLHLSPTAQVLAQGLHGPLIVLDRQNRRTNLIVGFDLWQSDWPEHVSFPIFMRNAMQFMALGSEMNVEATYSPGDAPHVSRTRFAKLGQIKAVTIDGPDGNSIVPVPPTGELAFPALEHVGLYSTQPPIPGMEYMAVNLLDENESNLEPVTLTNSNAIAATATAGRSQSDWWRWVIICGVLPLLLIEWWVYARRLHM